MPLGSCCAAAGTAGRRLAAAHRWGLPAALPTGGLRRVESLSTVAGDVVIRIRPGKDAWTSVGKELLSHITHQRQQQNIRIMKPSFRTCRQPEKCMSDNVSLPYLGELGMRCPASSRRQLTLPGKQPGSHRPDLVSQALQQTQALLKQCPATWHSTLFPCVDNE